jgi:hypothetical protein
METAGQDATIIDTLAGLLQGRFAEEATEQMRGLVKEMNRCAEVGGGKPKGKLVITINLHLDRGIYALEPSVKATSPSPARALTIMYSTPDGRLVKNAPPSPQHSLPLSESKDVSTTTDVRDVPSRPQLAS